MNDTIDCKLCHKSFKKITNTHLWKEHRITVDDYREQFPDSPLDRPGLAAERVAHLKGRSYDEVYGPEKALELKNKRKQSAKNQMKDPAQINSRKEKCGYEATNETRNKISNARTKHGQTTYRERALEHYGLECSRCGKTTENKRDFIVHPKDGTNSDHSINNLVILCKSCYGKIHNELIRTFQVNIGLKNIEKGVHYILKGLRNELGLDLIDENLIDTPKRVARAYAEIFSGIRDTDKQIEEILASKFPSEGNDEIIICKDVKVYSMCPHHLLPVEYTVHLGYLSDPNKYVIGVSKLARLAEILAKRPVLQERLTVDIGKTLDKLEGGGSIVYIKGIHFCMRMRGIKQQDSSIMTSYVSGVFKTKISAKNEFLSLIKS
jgi:GTP cyclohydrolase I